MSSSWAYLLTMRIKTELQGPNEHLLRVGAHNGKIAMMSQRELQLTELAIAKLNAAMYLLEEGRRGLLSVLTRHGLARA